MGFDTIGNKLVVNIFWSRWFKSSNNKILLGRSCAHCPYQVREERGKVILKNNECPATAIIKVFLEAQSSELTSYILIQYSKAPNNLVLKINFLFFCALCITIREVLKEIKFIDIPQKSNAPPPPDSKPEIGGRVKFRVQTWDQGEI